MALLVLPVTAETDKKKPKKIPLSLVIPGIHQMKDRSYAKGFLLLGSFIGATAGAIVYNKKGGDWYDKYSASTDVEAIVEFRRQTEDSYEKRNLFLAGIATVFLAHVIDLKFFKKGKGGVKGEAGKNNISIGVYYTF